MTSSRASSSTAGPVADPAAFADGLKAIIAGHDILRLKGFCDVPGKPMRLVVQAVGPAHRDLFRPAVARRARRARRGWS